MGTSTTGLDFSFGVGHREMVVDWGYRATHLMTVGRQADREDLLQPRPAAGRTSWAARPAATRRSPKRAATPTTTTASSPAIPRTTASACTWTATGTYEATHDDPASYIPPSKLPMINKAVLDACDKIDGLADGIIDDPRKCTFDPATHASARARDAADCLTAPQVAAMKKIYQGPKNPRTGEADLSRHVRRAAKSTRSGSIARWPTRPIPAGRVRRRAWRSGRTGKGRPTTGTRTRRWSSTSCRRCSTTRIRI